MFQVNGTFGSSRLQTVRKILDAHRNGILRVGDTSGRSGVLGIVPAFGGLHRVISSAAGFLHHDGLNQQNIIRNTILLGVFADDRLVGFHLCTEGQGFHGIILTSKDSSAAANQDDNYDHKNSRNTACANGGVKCLYRFCRRACQLGRQLCGLFCSQRGPASSGGCGMNTFLCSSGGGLLDFLGSLLCGRVGHFLRGSLGGLDRNERIPGTNGQVGFLLDRDFLFGGGITRRKRSVMETI